MTQENRILKNVFLDLGNGEVLADVKKSIGDQFKNSPGIHVDYVTEYDKRRIVISDNGPFEFVAPAITQEDLNVDFQDDLHLGVSVICSSNRNEILLVNDKSRGDDAWTLPGGLANEEDLSLFSTAKKHVAEQTGIQMSYIRNYRLCAYESVVTTESRSWHDVVVVFGNKVMNCDIEAKNNEARWWNPAEFYASYLRGEVATLDNIKILLKKWVAILPYMHCGVFSQSFGNFKECMDKADDLLLDLIVVSDPEVPYEHTEQYGCVFDRVKKEYERLKPSCS